MNNITIEDLPALLGDKRKIVIAGHVNPDGDAIGACFAFALCMRELGKEATVVLDKYSEKFDFLRGAECLYGGERADISGDCLVCLDCATKERLEGGDIIFPKFDLTINIDHHISNTEYCKYNLKQAASSTCEIMYEVAEAFGIMTDDVARAIYTGIVYDTDGFLHPSTTVKTHEITARLFARRIDYTAVYREVMKVHSLLEAKTFALALQNLTVDPDYPLSITYLTRDEMRALRSTSRDVDGIVEYILNLRGVSVALFLTERSADVKASMRSHELDVGAVAAVFGGGGHKNAAGATLHVGLDEAREAVRAEIIKKFDEA